MIPLKDIIIPPDYLLPDFKNHGEEKRKIEDIDIFQFGTRNIEKKCVMVYFFCHTLPCYREFCLILILLFHLPIFSEIPE